ncbi:MAG: hypothetical protein R3B09_08300 [Nannocystaceae bacterium]
MQPTNLLRASLASALRPALPPVLRPALALAGGALVFAFTAPAAATCTDSTGLCVVSGEGVKWKSEAALTAAQLRKENKKRKGSTSNLDLKIDDGRGTVFIDGRWGGIAPLVSYPITPGSHDIQVRDGNRILAEGVLVFPAGANVSIEIRH